MSSGAQVCSGLGFVVPSQPSIISSSLFHSNLLSTFTLSFIFMSYSSTCVFPLLNLNSKIMKLIFRRKWHEHFDLLIALASVVSSVFVGPIIPSKRENIIIVGALFKLHSLHMHMSKLFYMYIYI